MRFAYADPPYLGCSRLYRAHHPDAAVWDDRATHLALIEHLVADFDGFALSCLSRDLGWVLPACPEGTRIAAWVKPFGSGYKPDQRLVWAWEPVVFFTPRRRESECSAPRVRDVLTANATQGRGLPGVKPDAFNRWVLDLLGVTDGDELVDLFPGPGNLTRQRAREVLAVWDA